VLAKGVFGKTHPYALFMYFIPFYLDIWQTSPVLILENSKNI
jgi:hypothetical protein